MKNKFAIRFGFVIGLSLLAAGCNSASSEPKKGGTYTAARHSQIGSHIPQPQDAGSTNDTGMSAAELDRLSRQQEQLVSQQGAGGGGR